MTKLLIHNRVSRCMSRLVSQRNNNQSKTLEILVRLKIQMAAYVTRRDNNFGVMNEIILSLIVRTIKRFLCQHFKIVIKAAFNRRNLSVNHTIYTKQYL